MSGMNRNLVLAIAVAAAVVAPSAFATNGYFSHAYSLKESALAGTGVAMPQDSMAAATNPAGTAMVGQQIDLGISWFSPHRQYDTDLPSTFFGAPLPNDSTESDRTDFAIPNFGAIWAMNPNSAVGLSVYGNGGMNTTYPGSANADNGTFFGGAAGVDLAQVFFNLSYASKINQTSAWGVSGIFAYQRFKATGLAAFGSFSNDNSNLTDNGYDSSTGFGLKLGWMGEVSPGLNLGASYQSKINMKAFDKYKGLFAENGDFDIPSTWTVGLAYKTSPKTSLLFDVQRINYTDVKSVSNPESNLTSCAFGDASKCLGGNNGAGFGWHDMTVYKLGYQWQSNPDWTWRFGYSKGKQPIRDDSLIFNILAPGVIEQHFTFGFTNKINKGGELTLAAMIAPEKKVSGTDNLPASLGGPVGTSVELKMHQYELGVNYGWKF